MMMQSAVVRRNATVYNKVKKPTKVLIKKNTNIKVTVDKDTKWCKFGDKFIKTDDVAVQLPISTRWTE